MVLTDVRLAVGVKSQFRMGRGSVFLGLALVLALSIINSESAVLPMKEDLRRSLEVVRLEAVVEVSVGMMIKEGVQVAEVLVLGAKGPGVIVTEISEVTREIGPEVILPVEDVTTEAVDMEIVEITKEIEGPR